MTVIKDEVKFYFTSPYEWPPEQGSLPPRLYGPMSIEEAEEVASSLNLLRDVMDS